MNSVWPVMKKELRSFFNSPIAYIAVIFFLLSTALWTFFMQGFFAQDSASLRPFFVIMPAVFTVIVPAITMGLWAEERKIGTVELLITLPYGEWTLTIAKFLAGYVLVALMTLLTIPLPIMGSFLGELDLGQIVTEYLGVLLMGGASVALGAYVSSLTKNQITAFIVTLLVLLALLLAGYAPAWSRAAGAIGAFLKWISILYHFESFGKGVLDTRDVLYFVLMGSAFLFLTAKTLLFRKWR